MKTKYAPSDAPKRCTGCELVKPASEYHLHPKSLGGRHAKCRSCVKEADKSRGEKAKASSVHLTRLQKFCSKCKEMKGVSEFHRAFKSSDGLTFYCGHCDVKRVKKWRKERRETFVPSVEGFLCDE